MDVLQEAEGSAFPSSATENIGYPHLFARPASFQDTLVTTPTLLIPISFPEPEIYLLSDAYLEKLSGFSIVLLGYWEHELNAGEEVRADQEIEAEAVLYEIAAEFSHAGAATDIQLHFGPGGSHKRKLKKQVIEEVNPDGVLFAKRIEPLRNMLVPLRDGRHSENVVKVLSAFDPESVSVMELYKAATDDEAVESAKQMLQPIRDNLLSRGFSEFDLEMTVEVVEDVEGEIIGKARSHNIVVLGETENLNVDDYLFGSISNTIIDQTDTPVIIVR